MHTAQAQQECSCGGQGRENPIALSSRNGECQIHMHAALLLKHGVDINAWTNDYWTPLLVVANFGNDEVMPIDMQHCRCLCFWYIFTLFHTFHISATVSGVPHPFQ